ncbi:hypothetical protein [Streptomyces lavendofoliae]|uniref:Uncharacterized protein n=1 Tax=Streptomyces lavendofoliae TaxID=67314 RepID=A0A918M6U8_9ACTN|nr:hypothetical protein [Streptomyces lavendofoliae]GGU62557.1 hypothetical protein GCM10010274_59190 [Streptomyces lavendofoliae]
MNKDRTRSASPIPESLVNMDAALRRVVQAEIGPRRPGVVYSDGVTDLEVVQVVTDPSEARRILKRRAPQFAVIVRDIYTGVERATCAVWTGSDRVLKAVAA